METTLSKILFDFCYEYNLDVSQVQPVIDKLNSEFYFRLKDMKHLTLQKWKELNLPENLFNIINEKYQENLNNNTTSKKVKEVKQVNEVKEIEKKNVRYTNLNIINECKFSIGVGLARFKKVIQEVENLPINLDELEKLLNTLEDKINNKELTMIIFKMIDDIINNIKSYPNEDKYKKINIDKILQKYPYNEIEQILTTLKFKRIPDTQFMKFNKDINLLSQPYLLILDKKGKIGNKNNLDNSQNSLLESNNNNNLISNNTNPYNNYSKVTYVQTTSAQLQNNNIYTDQTPIIKRKFTSERVRDINGIPSYTVQVEETKVFKSSRRNRILSENSMKSNNSNKNQNQNPNVVNNQMKNQIQDNQIQNKNQNNMQQQNIMNNQNQNNLNKINNQQQNYMNNQMQNKMNNSNNQFQNNMNNYNNQMQNSMNNYNNQMQNSMNNYNSQMQNSMNNNYNSQMQNSMNNNYNSQMQNSMNNYNNQMQNSMNNFNNQMQNSMNNSNNQFQNNMNNYNNQMQNSMNNFNNQMQNSMNNYNSQMQNNQYQQNPNVNNQFQNQNYQQNFNHPITQRPQSQYGYQNPNNMNLGQNQSYNPNSMRYNQGNNFMNQPNKNVKLTQSQPINNNNNMIINPNSVLGRLQQANNNSLNTNQNSQQFNSFNNNPLNQEKSIPEILIEENTRRNNIILQTPINHNPKCFFLTSLKNIQTLLKKYSIVHIHKENDPNYIDYISNVINNQTNETNKKESNKLKQLMETPIVTQGDCYFVFPDKYVIKGIFCLYEKIMNMYDFIKFYLNNKNEKFILYLNNNNKIDLMNADILSMNFNFPIAFKVVFTNKYSGLSEKELNKLNVNLI